VGRLGVFAIVVAAGVIAWLYWSQGRTAPLVVSGFIEAHEVRVGSRVGGRVAKVHVEEGRRLQTGAIIFDIDPFDLREQLAEAGSRLAAARQEHARLAAGFRPQEVEQARAQRDAAGARLEKLAAGPRKQEIEIARHELEVAKANLQLAESEHARLERLA
jgi:multidrug resistance efflux pump